MLEEAISNKIHTKSSQGHRGQEGQSLVVTQAKASHEVEGRGKNEEQEEEEDITVAPSIFLAIVLVDSKKFTEHFAIRKLCKMFV